MSFQQAGQQVERLHIKIAPAAMAPMELLLEADPSLAQIQTYLAKSTCYVAHDEKETIGVYVLMPQDDDTFELMNIAVSPRHQGKGFGAELLQHAIHSVQALGATRLEVGTGAFGYQLDFYQKAGFRVHAVERDYFLTHYSEPLFESGIQHKDRLRLSIDFQATNDRHKR